MTFGRQNGAVTVTHSEPDVLCLAALLSDDDLVDHSTFLR
jgi:hypothetical protein